MSESKRRTTGYLIIATAIVWIVWDVFVYATVDSIATISSVVGAWLAYSPWIAFAYGLLCGHLAASMPSGPNEIVLWALIAMGVVSGVILTRII